MELWVPDLGRAVVHRGRLPGGREHHAARLVNADGFEVALVAELGCEA